MDISKFEQQVSPGGKRSKLEPFKAQIFELKFKGYADWQVADWLGKNNVEVSRQAVQQFCKKEAAAFEEFKLTANTPQHQYQQAAQQHQQAAQQPQKLQELSTQPKPQQIPLPAKPTVANLKASLHNLDDIDPSAFE